MITVGNPSSPPVDKSKHAVSMSRIHQQLYNPRTMTLHVSLERISNDGERFSAWSKSSGQDVPKKQHIRKQIQEKKQHKTKGIVQENKQQQKQMHHFQKEYCGAERRRQIHPRQHLPYNGRLEKHPSKIKEQNTSNQNLKALKEGQQNPKQKSKVRDGCSSGQTSPAAIHQKDRTKELDDTHGRQLPKNEQNGSHYGQLTREEFLRATSCWICNKFDKSSLNFCYMYSILNHYRQFKYFMELLLHFKMNVNCSSVIGTSLIKNEHLVEVSLEKKTFQSLVQKHWQTKFNCLDNNKKISCEQCQAVSEGPLEYVIHRDIHNPKTPERYVCPFCGILFRWLCQSHNFLWEPCQHTWARGDGGDPQFLSRIVKQEQTFSKDQRRRKIDWKLYFKNWIQRDLWNMSFTGISTTLKLPRDMSVHFVESCSGDCVNHTTFFGNLVSTHGQGGTGGIPNFCQELWNKNRLFPKTKGGEKLIGNCISKIESQPKEKSGLGAMDPTLKKITSSKTELHSSLESWPQIPSHYDKNNSLSSRTWRLCRRYKGVC